MSHLLCNLPRFHLGLGPRSVDLPPPDVMEQLLIDLIALIPGGARHILRFGLPEEVFLMMPNIRVLHLVGVRRVPTAKPRWATCQHETPPLPSIVVSGGC